MSTSHGWVTRLDHFARLLRVAPRMLARRTPRVAGAPRVRFIYSQLGAATRYRVLHQIEQARLSGLQVQDVAVDDLDQLYDLRDCDLLYLYRLALNSRTWPLLVAARLRGIPTLFDSDDLVWDVRERDYNYLDDHYAPEVIANILLTTRRMAACMRRVDGFVCSTPFLAQLVRQSFGQPVFVNRNALGQAQVAAADHAFRQRQPHHDPVVIGYFCGTPHVHDEDLASIAPALATVLALCPAARLRIYGTLTLPPALAGSFADRIERCAVVSWEALPEHIAQIDINIAPLVDNPQRRAKSAVKYLEAASLRVPTVAARLDPYTDVILDGATGLLAEGVGEWAAALLRLVHDPALRQRLGEVAYAQAIAEHTTAVRAPEFAKIISTFP